MTRAAILRSLRPVAAPLAVIVLYAVASLAFQRASGVSGLLTTNGSLRPTVLALGALTLTLRVAALFVAAPWIVGRAASSLSGRVLARVRR